MTEKKKDDIVADDVKEMADLYMELDTILGAAKLSVKPTGEDLQKMVVSLFIHRADSGRMLSAPKAAAQTPQKAAVDKGKYPDRECPACHQMIGVQFGKESGKPYYACKTDNCFVNDDGTMTARKPFKKG